MIGQPTKFIGRPAKNAGQPTKRIGQPAKITGRPTSEVGRPSKLQGKIALIVIWVMLNVIIFINMIICVCKKQTRLGSSRRVSI